MKLLTSNPDHARNNPRGPRIEPRIRPEPGPRLKPMPRNVRGKWKEIGGRKSVVCVLKEGVSCFSAFLLVFTIYPIISLHFPMQSLACDRHMAKQLGHDPAG